MFLIIPLVILVASLASISYIVFKKLKLAKELDVTTEAGTSGSFLKAMYPEIFGYFQRVNVAAHKSNLLLEFEKFLRRSRIYFLRIDNLSNRLLHKVRETHLNEVQKAQEKVVETQKAEEVKAEAEAVAFIESVTTADTPALNEFKRREYEMVLAIAKNPKDQTLYKNLGELYLEAQQWQDARESFTSALQLDPKIRGVKSKLKLADKMLSLQRSH